MEVCGQSGLVLAEIGDPLLPLWLMELLAGVFFYTWLFALGATVGSFLNVVIYRLPRGKNLAFPGSYCPQCGVPIRLSDNIPIVSWLVLWGRCRHCRGPISPRYFVVELLIATLFLVVLLAEYFLPPLAVGGLVRRPLATYDGLPFWVMYAVHASLGTTIVGGTLIAADGFRVPARLFFPVLIAALAAGLVWPAIRSAPAMGYGDVPAWQAGLIDGLCGLAAGLIVGGGFELVAFRMGRGGSSVAPLAFAATLGATFGWQRVLWAAPLALLASGWAAHWLAAIAERRRVSAEESQPASAPVELPLEATTPPTSDAIQEEIHIAPGPTEPTESS